MGSITVPKNTRSTLKIKEDTVWSKKTGPAFYVVKYHRFDNKDWYLGEDSLVEDFEEAKAMNFQEAKDYAYDFIDGLFIENEVPSYILEEMAEDEKKDYDDWDELAKSSCGLVDDYPARQYILDNMEVVPIYASFQESKRNPIDRFEDWYLGEQTRDRVPPSIKKADNIIRKYLGEDPFKKRMTPREAFQALPEEGKAEINAYLDQILGVELGESKKFSEHYNDPDLLDDLVNYYASFDTMSPADIWEEIYNKYKDENLADEVIESLENDNPYDQEDEDFYEDHAEEWLNRHPHGWYNSENDYGVDWDDPDLPYVGSGNPDWKLGESLRVRESSEFDYSGWKKEDIELHKKIDWEARDYKEYIVPGTEYEGSTRFYTEDGLKIVKEAYAKRLRVNFPPYYGPVDNTSTKKWTSAMYDGRHKDGYDVHDRRESWYIYNALSENKLKESTNLAQRYMDFYNDNSHYNEDGVDGYISKSEEIIHKYLGDKMYDMNIDVAVDALPTEGKMELMAYLDKLEYGYLEEDYDREKKVLDLFKEDVDDFIGVTTKVCLDPRHGYYLYVSANRIAYHAFVRADGRIRLQVNEIHPYDDASYYSAHCKDFIDSDMWDFNLNGRTKFSKMCTSIDEVLATLKEKNKNIEPRMMHN